MMPALFLVAGRTGWFAIVADVDRIINPKAPDPADWYERLHIRGPMPRPAAIAEGTDLVRSIASTLPPRSLNKRGNRSRFEANQKEALP